jgi:anthranilate phosphoribosyltransferase
VAIARRVLDGAAGGPRDVVLLNAGASLLISGQASTVREGITVAAEAIDSGRAAAVLEKLIACSRQESAVA